MSVIHFRANDAVWGELAVGFEQLKGRLDPAAQNWLVRVGDPSGDSTLDGCFYKSLRRLYFANVAAFLCQYHDDTPLPPAELTAISTFAEFDRPRDPAPVTDTREAVKGFARAWRQVSYNLVTNDGEEYHPGTAYRFFSALVERFLRLLIE